MLSTLGAVSASASKDFQGKGGKVLGSEEKEYLEISQITENKAAQTLAQYICATERG